jgi:hypothetical protein
VLGEAPFNLGDLFLREGGKPSMSAAMLSHRSSTSWMRSATLSLKSSLGSFIRTLRIPENLTDPDGLASNLVGIR